MRSVAVIQADIDSTEAAVKAGGVDQSQIDVWNMQIADFKVEIKTAEDHDQAQQQAQIDREQAQEEEVQAITLPYDFNDILSEPDHPVTAANEMIIEVVRDVKRQANIEKNQAVDDVKVEYDGKLRVLQTNIDDHKNVIVELTQNLADLKDDYNDLEIQKNQLQSQHETMHQKASQAITDRDDAYTKRDNAFRDLQAAREEIDRLQKQLEAMPAAKTIEISSSDKLAQMVKDSLAEKVNRGLSRWNLPAIEVPSMPAATAAENSAAQEEHPKDEVSDGNTEGNSTVEGNTAIPQSLGERTATEENPVTGRYNPFPQTGNHSIDIQNLQMAHLDLIDQIDALKTAHGTRLDRLDKQANLPEVA